MSSNPEAPKEELDVQTESESDTGERARGRRRRSRSVGSEVSVNMDEVRELIQLVRENDFSEFELEREGFRVRFRRGAEVVQSASGSASVAREVASASAGTSAAESKVASTAAPVHPGAKAQTEASEDQDLYLIPS